MNVTVDLNATPSALARCQRLMASAGWEIEYVDLDLTKAQPTAEIKLMRADGRWLWAKVDPIGRCTIETFHRERTLGMAKNQNGRRPLVPLVDDVFLGRQRHEGARSMLRGMTNYLADNALHPVALADVRAAWASVMAAPTTDYFLLPDPHNKQEFHMQQQEWLDRCAARFKTAGDIPSERATELAQTAWDAWNAGCLPELAADHEIGLWPSFAVHVYPEVMVKIDHVRAPSHADAFQKAMDAVSGNTLHHELGRPHVNSDLGQGMKIVGIQYADGGTAYTLVDQVDDTGEPIEGGSKTLDDAGHPLVDGLTPTERSALLVDKTRRFMDELLHSVESLSGIAIEHGLQTLVDITYLQAAILSDEHIDQFSGTSHVWEVVSALPSGAEWARYIWENGVDPTRKAACDNPSSRAPSPGM